MRTLSYPLAIFISFFVSTATVVLSEINEANNTRAVSVIEIPSGAIGYSDKKDLKRIINGTWRAHK